MNAIPDRDLNLTRIFRFWLPLAATWLMMSVEGPLLAALIARLADPKFNLAAYGVAFSFALIIEAPIIMIMSASTALVTERHSFLKLRNFTLGLNLLVTALMVVLILPPVFEWVAYRLIELPDEVGRLAHVSLIILLPWPAVIGYRRFYQGILIRHNLTRRVAYGTVVRVVSMTVAALVLYAESSLPGAYLGAAALSIGVTLEALASRWMVHATLKSIPAAPAKPAEPLNYRAILHFYYPLALTSTLSLGVHPLITFFLGRSRMAVESLAVLPVVISLVFLFRSLGLAYQEVGIALIGEQMQGYRPLRRFATLLMIFTSVCLFTIAFTPLHRFWFNSVSGLSAPLTDLAGTTLRIMAILPASSVLLSFQRAMLVNFRTTHLVTWATALEVMGVFLVLFSSIHFLGWIGAWAAATALVAGRTAGNLFLALALRAKSSP